MLVIAIGLLDLRGGSDWGGGIELWLFECECVPFWRTGS
jgi:hypothetical protein